QACSAAAARAAATHALIRRLRARAAAQMATRFEKEGTMQNAPRINRRIVLAARPRGEPVLSDFRLEEVPVPPVGNDEVLLQTLWLSLDPYMRGTMDEEDSYVASVDIGGLMRGG